MITIFSSKNADRTTAERLQNIAVTFDFGSTMTYSSFVTKTVFKRGNDEIDWPKRHRDHAGNGCTA